ncbi:hypothetical protein GCM10010095_58410 [Streptomyces anthocyanicus]|uniref:Hypothetical hydrophilic protein n=1 Tax=Streptomyces coelicolor (strain ATCC BAA-471 / A3(2) / M145) TaxID=100226 RepID=Q9X9X0_STRCO|nr:hypothetical protein [Streptomyces sp. SID7813]QFI42083.1 hypothetical protein FQ762_09690 [Streptomyces coelicolor A3(2)]GGL65738.1 hypothetical protein GCM10010095_58410 [Streptomyces anthocyanicus]CAB46403.1 hypothetical hydrophilic protein [Streptomyces coelicolor A3(2)]
MPPPGEFEDEAVQAERRGSGGGSPQGREGTERDGKGRGGGAKTRGNAAPTTRTLPRMPKPNGFAYTATASGTVHITHHNRPATTLNGSRAARFLEEVTAGDPQLVMARWTGTYKHGNERTARNHPRNRR